MTDKITDYMGLETAATQFHRSNNNSCSLTAKGNTRKIPGGTETLQKRGGEFASYLMLRGNQGTGPTINDP
jgi:hypothetical protein